MRLLRDEVTVSADVVSATMRILPPRQPPEALPWAVGVVARIRFRLHRRFVTKTIKLVQPIPCSFSARHTSNFDPPSDSEVEAAASRVMGDLRRSLQDHGLDLTKTNISVYLNSGPRGLDLREALKDFPSAELRCGLQPEGDDEED